MKNYLSHSPLMTYTAALFLGLTVTSCSEDSPMNDNPTVPIEEKIVVANREAGSISFIDAKSNMLAKTLSIPNSEPMYLVYVAKTDKIYVGDRAGKKIHVISPQSYQVEKSIDGGDGIFHMWADGQGKELWVVNDIDNTISVIDLNTNAITTTIDIDAKPHDVFITEDGSTAYISVFTEDPSSDMVYKYSVSTHAKTGEASVGKEPHLYHLSSNKLFVPCQSGQVYILDSDMNIVSEKDYTGAHGIFAAPDMNAVFVSNISGNQLYSINSATGEQLQNPVESSAITPHNIVLNSKGDKMFVTHSNTAVNAVSVYNVSSSGIITPSASIQSATNPFGLTYYKREQK